MNTRLIAVVLLLCGGVVPARAQQKYTPPLRGAVNGTATLRTDEFLTIPQAVADDAKKDGAAPFVVATEAPTVDLAFHGDLPPGERKWWSAWGDIAVASDGRVYVGIGDHGDDAAGDAHALVYRYDPKTKKLEPIIDVNALVERKQGEPAFAKIHARIDEGKDGRIYFTGTLGNGGLADDPKYKWSDTLPGGQLYAYDPQTGKTEIITNLPRAYVSVASLLDVPRNVWWCNLDRDNKNALWAFDLNTGKQLIRFPEGSVSLNRNFALGHDGSLYFNGPDAVIWKYDPSRNDIAATKSKFPDKGMRCSTPQTSRGEIYGITMGQHQIFRYVPASDELTLLGPCFLTGHYTTVCALSPDEKYVYFMSGGPGAAVVQYEIASGQRKVVAFLGEVFDKQFNFVPGYPFGLKLSNDGSTVYMNYHGAAAERVRGKDLPAGGICAFTAVHIPSSQRQ